MNENTALLEETTDQKPDSVFTQEIDGWEYRVRVFFPGNNPETLQEKVERIIRTEMMKTISGEML